MRKRLGAAIMLAMTLCAPAFGEASLFAQFEWPATDESVIPDLRLNDVVQQAREEAREAEGRAKDGRLYAGQASRRGGLRSAVGLKAQSATIDDGTVITAIPYYGDTGPALGVIRYSGGASMTGIFGPDTGVYVAAPESTLEKFEGWVFGAATAEPRPLVGIFRLRNGDTFTGDQNSGLGVYVEAGNGRKFVGRTDFSFGAFRPSEGVVLDPRGRLLAVER
tara:strand:- start:1834 stop:2496 length:663 start_codon:yes stop_codon:yes gene_type:complete